MTEKQMIDLFYTSFFDLEFDECKKIVGHMQYSNLPSARYFDMLLNYEIGNYNVVRRTLKGKSMNKDEEELYLASLAELHLYNELYEEAQRINELNRFCLDYINILLKQNDKTVLKNITAIQVQSTYFKNRFFWTISKIYATVYHMNKDKLLMLNEPNNVEIDYVQRKLLNLLDTVIIKDPFGDEIRRAVENNLPIDKTRILWFPYNHIAKHNIDGIPKMKNSFDSICDIVNYLEICRLIEHDNLEYELIVEYLDIIRAAERGNSKVLELLKNIYIDCHYYRRGQFNDIGDTLCDLILSVIIKNAPHMKSEIDCHATDSEILAILSNKGKLAYKAAIWQFANAITNEIGIMDAGMLCLSYMRILELEINERIFSSFRNKYQQIIAKLESAKQSSKEAEKFEKYWMDRISMLKVDANNPAVGLELGALAYFLISLKKDSYGKRKSENGEFAKELRNMFDDILTKKGIEALENGDLEKMINKKVREKYRNPPAHTRYVGIKTALECREYVENSIFKLNEYIK